MHKVCFMKMVIRFGKEKMNLDDECLKKIKMCCMKSGMKLMMEGCPYTKCWDKLACHMHQMACEVSKKWMCCEDEKEKCKLGRKLQMCFKAMCAMCCKAPPNRLCKVLDMLCCMMMKGPEMMGVTCD